MRRVRRVSGFTALAIAPALVVVSCSTGNTTGELSAPDGARHGIDGKAAPAAGAQTAGNAAASGSGSRDQPGAGPSEMRPDTPSAGDPAGTDDPTLLEAAPVAVPQVSAPQLLGTLVGPGTREPPPGLALYGTDLGISFEHAGQLHMLFGDTWPDGEFICRNRGPLNDDVLARLPLPPQYTGGIPQLSFVTDPAAPDQPRAIRLLRGEQSLSLGYGQVPMTAFSDGAHAYAFFARLQPTRCGAKTGEPECPLGDGLECSARIGECLPAYTTMTLSCDLETKLGCLPGQTCTGGAPTCVDRTSAQYDGSVPGETSAIAQQTELAIQSADDPTQFTSILAWPTNKFATLTARAVARFGGTSQDNDYAPGHGALLVWGRSGFVAEHGRETQLYLMTHELPLQLNEAGQLQFAPRYFAGVDRSSGEPLWTSEQAQARPLALDGVMNGDPHEELQFVGQMAVSWLPAPISKWVMLYGGDLTDFLLIDGPTTRSARAPGAIVMRFADQPWGPWSPPVPHLQPGKPSVVGDWYGPGGQLYHPACVDRGEDRCARSDARRPHETVIPGCPFSSPELDPGRLYGVNIVDAYTRGNEQGGLDLTWNVSVWNPYAVVMLETQVTPPPSDVSPGELSDARGLQRMSEWRSLPTLEAGRRYRQQTSRDRGTSDTSFPLSNHGNRDFNNFVCASKDARMSANQFTPFRFDQPECEEAYVHGVVLGRFEGSGRMVRMWLGAASLLNGPADDELLRIYVDDGEQPAVELPLAAVLDGSAGEIFAPPFGAGSPRRMAWYYPVAFQHKLIVALDRLGDYDEYYFHCDVVHDDDVAASGAPRASLRDRQRAQARLSAVYHPGGVFPELMAPEKIELAAGARRAVELAGPATIFELRVRVAEDQLAALAAVRVSATWDGAAQPAIDELSLIELLASPRTPPERSTQALTSYSEAGDRFLQLKLPMPFTESARLTFTNGGRARAVFELALRGAQALPAAPFGKLHVLRNETDAPTTQTDTVSVDVAGRGRLVGVCAFLEGRPDAAGGIQYDPLNLLEGDVRIAADGELALDGTGTEEYADDVFYFKDAPHANAFVQAWGVVDDVRSSLLGRANLCRWHVLGTEIDFERSLQVRFELGGASNPQTVASHHTVAYVYLE